MNEFKGIEAGPEDNTEEREKHEWLRDMFAAHVMTGLLADPTFDASPRATALLSYRAADAMVAVREMLPCDVEAELDGMRIDEAVDNGDSN